MLQQVLRRPGLLPEPAAFSDLLHDEAEDLDDNNQADQDHEHGNKAHQNNLNGADVGLHNLTSFHRSVMEIKIENVICILKKHHIPAFYQNGYILTRNSKFRNA